MVDAAEPEKNQFQIGDQPILDVNKVQAIRELTEEGEEDFLNSLITIFLERSENAIDCIQKGIDESNPSALTKAAHSLKGSSGNLGLNRLMMICERLEKLARAENLSEALRLKGQLIEIYDSSLLELKKWIKH
jgi:HPt (histidine-containing phosphotransfer) domain-containing protein